MEQCSATWYSRWHTVWTTRCISNRTPCNTDAPSGNDWHLDSRTKPYYPWWVLGWLPTVLTAQAMLGVFFLKLIGYLGSTQIWNVTSFFLLIVNWLSSASHKENIPLGSDLRTSTFNKNCRFCNSTFQELHARAMYSEREDRHGARTCIILEVSKYTVRWK